MLVSFSHVLVFDFGFSYFFFYPFSSSVSIFNLILIVAYAVLTFNVVPAVYNVFIKGN